MFSSLFPSTSETKLAPQFSGIKLLENTDRQQTINTLHYKQSWVSSSNYSIGDIVLHDDDLFMCIKDVDSRCTITLTDLEYFRLISNQQFKACTHQCSTTVVEKKCDHQCKPCDHQCKPCDHQCKPCDHQCKPCDHQCSTTIIENKCEHQCQPCEHQCGTTVIEKKCDHECLQLSPITVACDYHNKGTVSEDEDLKTKYEKLSATDSWSLQRDLNSDVDLWRIKVLVRRDIDTTQAKQPRSKKKRVGLETLKFSVYANNDQSLPDLYSEDAATSLPDGITFQCNDKNWSLNYTPTSHVNCFYVRITSY